MNFNAFSFSLLQFAHYIMHHHTRLFSILTIVSILLLSSCIHHRELVNFNEGPQFSTAAETIANQNPILLQPDDLLSISVQSVDPRASAPFNFVTPEANKSESGAIEQRTNTTGQPNFLIDATGTINFPMLGQVKAAGLSTQQLRDSLTLKISKYVQSPIVNVRLTNFRFTIMGEVSRAGTFSIANERINILQALGMAGDLTNYGNRENILIIRERDGKREFGHLNLHQRDLFQSPYFVLMQNDLIYVEPLPAKIGATADGATKYLQWALPVISIISIVVSLTR